MPWHVAKSGSCPASKPFAVIKDSDGSVAGCHPTKAAAQKQMAALYANEGNMTSTSAAPVDNLVRALFGAEGAELRAKTDDGDGRTLHGHFAVFDRWAEIDSYYEGHFLERIAPGAFARTIAERGNQIKVLYDHGQDPSIGNKPLGTIESLTEDKVGAAYEVRLIETPYNNDFVIPAARAGLLGASFRFQVTGEDWVEPEEPSRFNPDKLKERTITDVDLYEFGPVTFPAYEAASAAVRCGTDRFFDSLANDPRFVARFTERLGGDVVERIIAGLPPKPTPSPDATDGSRDNQQTTDEAADGPDDVESLERRRLRHQQRTAGFDAHLTRLTKDTPE